MTRKFVCLLTAGAVSAAMAAPASAGSVVTALGATLTANPAHYIGACPGVITFKGVVTARGSVTPAQPVEIGYQFTRSDGATGPNQFFNITAPGPHTISETWTLGGPSLPSYAGWERFKAWPTDSLQGGGKVSAVSNEAHFTLRCLERPPPPPRQRPQ